MQQRVERGQMSHLHSFDALLLAGVHQRCHFSELLQFDAAVHIWPRRRGQNLHQRMHLMFPTQRVEHIPFADCHHQWRVLWLCVHA